LEVNERWLSCDTRVCSCDARFCAIHVNHREEHDVGDDGSYGSCCNTSIFTLVEEMKSGANGLHDCGTFFLWDVRLGQDRGEMSLTSLELGVMPCLEEDSGIVSLMFHGGFGACDDARVEDPGFEGSNHRMDM
jgi:hypothetical protein